MPWLLERKFGIRAFDYWWGYTAAQIELMLIDGPVIDYDYKKSDAKKSMILTKSEEDEMAELVKEWNEDRQGMTYVGKTFSLDDFMSGKV